MTCFLNSVLLAAGCGLPCCCLSLSWGSSLTMTPGNLRTSPQVCSLWHTNRPSVHSSCHHLSITSLYVPLGPPWIPVLGSALYVHRLRKQTGYLYRATAELARCYGPVVGLRVGKDRQVVLCGYEAIKDMLSRDDFDGRPQGPFYETRTWGKRRGECQHATLLGHWC
jgi:hypothetical protein